MPPRDTIAAPAEADTSSPPTESAIRRIDRRFGSASAASGMLLAWYDRHARDLPWRAQPGDAAGPKADPYHVWLSEIMLQQTTVATVRSYFSRFVDRWPTVTALAAAPLDDVLHAWQGLGYYARARNLHRCAQVIAYEHQGAFPRFEADLLKLPGVGAYTAAAIAAIAFDRKATVVDGNVERVMARLHAVDVPMPAAKPELKRLAALTTPNARPGDYAQAVMDLGATICTPRKPQCLLCPWQAGCEGHRIGIAVDLPRKAPKKKRPVRHGHIWWIAAPDGRVMLRRRPEKGLLGGMMEFPGTPWAEDKPAITDPPVRLATSSPAGAVTHIFTHFQLELTVINAVAESTALPDNAVWADAKRLGDFALPTVMKKVAAVIQSEAQSGSKS